jgi:pimeloyl-ACP methyl ester carboxylesterase
MAHDRGARVAHRLALDHPDKVKKMILLDIAPTLWMYEHTSMEFVSVSVSTIFEIVSRRAHAEVRNRRQDTGTGSSSSSRPQVR